MGYLSWLDWFLLIDLLAFGVIVAKYIEREYRFPWHNFMLLTFFVACVAAMLVIIYDRIKT